VEVQAVVEATLHQRDEVAGGDRHLVTVDLGGEGAEEVSKVAVGFAMGRSYTDATGPGGPPPLPESR